MAALEVDVGDISTVKIGDDGYWTLTNLVPQPDLNFPAPDVTPVGEGGEKAAEAGEAGAVSKPE